MSFIQFATALVGLMGAALLVYEVWRACKSHAAPGEDERRNNRRLKAVRVD